ncbi:MAG: diacylglycerol kinase family lipid kinase [Acidobacteria bacterium]|nr:MAG: diacylglycerol kinase family lipid kinase [Acidobacteriota bacterium]
MPAVKWCVIVNPNAGSVDDITALEKSLGRLDSFELKETRGPKDAGELAKRAVGEGITHVAAAGGDGTLNEILNGVADHLEEITLGVLPLGTGNDFANSVGMPTDHDQAIDILAAGKSRMVDVLRLRNRDLSSLFLNTSAGGFVTKANEKLTTESKDWLGSVAFFVAAARTLPEMEEYQLRVKFDEDEFQEFGAYNVVVANGRTMGGGIPVAPQAKLDDGLMDVMIVPAMPLAKLAVVLPQILVGIHPGGGDVIVRQAKRMLISSQPNFNLNVDGEVIGEAPALFDVLPKALRVVVNPDAATAFEEG